MTVDVPSPPESVDQIVKIYEQAMTPKTRVIMVSHMTYVTGLITPIKELADLAHRRGALISVDGAHPLGMLDLDLKATTSTTTRPPGRSGCWPAPARGVCYIKRDVQDRIWPLMGYADLKTTNDPKPRVRRTKTSSAASAMCRRLHGMAAAMDFQRPSARRTSKLACGSSSTTLRAGLKGIPGVKMWTSEDPAVRGRAHAVLACATFRWRTS